MMYPTSLAAATKSSYATPPNPALLAALEGLLRDAIVPIVFDYLKKGIGTATPKGKAILAAQAAVAAAKAAA